MRPVAAATALLLLTGGGALAAPPTAEQKAEFYSVCTQRGAAELCACKADAAMSLVDSAFMDVIVESMSGKALAAEHAVAYNDYIAASTRACGMGGI